VPEIVAKVEAVDTESVTRVARRLATTPPTVAALGPLGNLESYDRVLERLA
jgi:predicted Zn-dependent peptidase